MNTSVLITFDDSCYAIRYAKIVPYDVSELFTECHRKITIEGLKPTDGRFSTSLCVSASQFCIATDLDEVSTLFDSYQHDESTIGQAIVSFINLLNRADLQSRYELFKEKYPLKCNIYESDVNSITKQDIMAKVINNSDINPKRSTDKWASLSIVE